MNQSPRKRLGRPWVIGGHDAAVILGRSRFETPLHLWARKLGKIPAEDLSGSPVIQRGNALEPHLLELYQQTTHRELAVRSPQGDHRFLSTGEPVNLLRQHAEHKWAVAPLDSAALDEDGDVVDVDAKTANIFTRESWGEPPMHDSVVRDGKRIPLPTATSIPIEYAIQLQHYLWVTGHKTASFAVGIVDDRHYREPVETPSGYIVFGLVDFLWCDMKRNEGFIEAMVEHLVRFTRYLESGERPPDELTWRDHDWFADLVGKENAGLEVELGEDGTDLVARVHAAINNAEDAERRKKDARAKLMERMGEAATGILPSGKRVHFKTQKDTAAKHHTCTKCGNQDELRAKKKGRRVLYVPQREKAPA